MGVAFFLCVQTWQSRPAGGGVPGLLGGWYASYVLSPFRSVLLQRWGVAMMLVKTKKKGVLDMVLSRTPCCVLSCLLLFGVGGFLLSHNLPVAVPSALAGLASGFGMGPGVSLLL